MEVASAGTVGPCAEAETTVVASSARSLPPASEPFDLIFMDPPYGKRLIEPALESLHENGWIAASAVIIIESGKNEEIALPAWLSKLNQRIYGKTIVLITGAVSATPE